jgi:hypothetical protein
MTPRRKFSWWKILGHVTVVPALVGWTGYGIYSAGRKLNQMNRVDVLGISSGDLKGFVRNGTVQDDVVEKLLQKKFNEICKRSNPSRPVARIGQWVTRVNDMTLDEFDFSTNRYKK